MHERRSLSLAPASTPHRPESREQLKDVLGNAPGRELHHARSLELDASSRGALP